MDFGGFEFKAGPLAASFFGAMVYAVLMRVKHPWRIFTIVFVGMTTSYFMGSLIVDQITRLGFSNVDVEGLANSSSFITGLTGMAICNGVIEVVRKLAKKGGKTDE